MESLIAVLLLAALALVAYFAPTIIAYMRAHQQRVPILLLNLLLGWTVLGWIGALIWASTHVNRDPVSPGP